MRTIEVHRDITGSTRILILKYKTERLRKIEWQRQKPIKLKICK
jgi:hypothetical protein